VRSAVLVSLLLILWAPRARAETETPAPPAAAAPEPQPGTPSFLELAERLRGVGSFSECAVEALRYGYDRPADRGRGFERAALCLSLAGRYDDARRLMLALPSEGTPLDGRARLRICLSEVFLADLDAPACPSLEPPTRRDRFDQLAHEALLMQKIHARRWSSARQQLDGLGRPSVPALSLTAHDFTDDPTARAWRRQDHELVRRHDELGRKSPLLAGALSALIPGLGRVYLGRWPDGLLSFLLVGTTGALAAQGFYQDGRDSVRGWILGSVAALLYAGNVYGSAVGAVVQRRDAEDALMVEVDREYQGRLDP
jgi:TM2 domain-containing membrane protein YozV